MSKKKGSSSKLEDYELMPIKPLRDMQKQVKQLRKELKKEKKSEKLLVKLLNSNLKTQQKIVEQNYKIEEIKTHLRKFVEIIKDLEMDDEHNREVEKLHIKLDDLHDKHDNLTRAFKSFNTQTSFNAFRRLPSGIPIRYRKKNEKDI